MVSGHTPELRVRKIRLKYSAVIRTQIHVGLGFLGFLLRITAIRSTKIFSLIPKVL